MSFIPSTKVLSTTPTGSNSSPALTFSSDSDTGLYDVSDGTLGVSTNGVLAASFTSSQQLNMNSHKIVSVADPTVGQDVATKNYVDNVAAGLDVKAAVRVATTGNLSVTASGSQVGKTLTATANGAISIDGVSLSLNDRVLVKNQSTAVDNGIYTVTTVGDGSHPYVLTRATDFDGSPSNEVQGGDFVFVEAGSQIATGWTVIATSSIVVDTNSINWTQFNASAAYIADESTLHLAGTTFSIKTGFTPIFANDGTSTNPTYAFNTNTGTGLYRRTSGPTSLAVAVNGIDACYFTQASQPQLQVSGGSVGAPTYSFGSYPTTGMYAIGTNILGLATAGVEAIRVDASQKVGIGTTPADKLHVLGNVVIEHTGLGIDLRRATYDEYFIGQIGTGLTIKNQTQGSTVLNADTNNKIGINTSSPSGNYQVRIDATNRLGVSIVSGASASAAYLFLENDGANTYSLACNGTTSSNPNTLEIDYNGSVRTRWATGTGDIDNFFTANTNGQQQFTWRNAGTGYGSFTAVNTAASQSLQMGAVGTGAGGNWYTGVPIASSCYIQANTTNALAIQTNGAGSIILLNTNNTTAMSINSTQHVFFTDGAVATPSISFLNDGTTGLSRVGGGLQISAGGVNVMAAFSNGAQLFVRDGSVGAPSFAFNSSNNTGIFYNGGNTFCLASNGAEQFRVGNSVVELRGSTKIQNTDGSVSAPAYSFSQQPNSGMYRSAANFLDFAANGVNILNLQSTGIAVVSGNCQPEADNTRSLGTALRRWSDMYAVNVHAGDVTLDNGWAITEGDKVGRDKDEVLLKSPTGKIYKFVLEEVTA